ncbi:OmpA family protein [uncultured Sulfitobacter sp.]|uniref:OmpA family protein n=1 Tax=uncultured Sulfitobacter sp. TaxID=191468 RepID=UPI002636608A|nr:OmpA family protein [uncultured Sulfitobacter sp.]
MFEKSKTAEMQRLRAAGFSLANAERLSRNKRGPGKAIVASAVVGLVLVGGIIAVGFDMTRQVDQALQTATNAQPSSPVPVQAAAPVIAPAAAPEVVAVNVAKTQQSDEQLGETTLRALQQSRLSQSLAVQEAAQAANTDLFYQTETVTRATGGVSSTLDALTSAAVQEIAQEAVAEPVETSATATIEADCVTELASLVRGVTLPFNLASARLPDEDAPVLGNVVEGLNNCPDARLMVAGHSDSTGPEIANFQMSWQRAEATMSRLVAMGATEDQLEAIGFGTRVPFDPNVLSDAPENRRVDFRVLRREETNG